MKNFGELFGRLQSRKSRSSRTAVTGQSAAAKRRRKASQTAAPERLEQRLLLATDVWNQFGGLGETQYGWTVFTQGMRGMTSIFARPRRRMLLEFQMIGSIPITRTSRIQTSRCRMHRIGMSWSPMRFRMG